MAPRGAQHSVQDLEHSESKCVSSIFNPNLVSTRAQQPSLGSDTIPKRAVTLWLSGSFETTVRILNDSIHEDINGNFNKCLRQEQEAVQFGAL